LELSLFVGRLLIRHNVLLGDNLVAATILENLAKFVNYHTFTASHRFFKFLRASQKTDCLEANSLDLNVMAEFALQRESRRPALFDSHTTEAGRDGARLHRPDLDGKAEQVMLP